jgi:hypothetical protein
MKHKHKIHKDPEFYVMDKFNNFFAGYRMGSFYWSDKISEARELVEPEQFATIVRYEPWREPRAEYIEW